LSKTILDEINSKLNLNQLRNTKQVIEWFGNIKDKERHIFISFDIVDFYPSISEKLLDQALSWASNLTTISDNDILTIKHARKSLLFNTGKPWTKKDIKFTHSKLFRSNLTTENIGPIGSQGVVKHER
jgi:hypothetical protein